MKTKTAEWRLRDSYVIRHSAQPPKEVINLKIKQLIEGSLSALGLLFIVGSVSTVINEGDSNRQFIFESGETYPVGFHDENGESFDEDAFDPPAPVMQDLLFRPPPQWRTFLDKNGQEHWIKVEEEEVPLIIA